MANELLTTYIKVHSIQNGIVIYLHILILNEIVSNMNVATFFFKFVMFIHMYINIYKFFWQNFHIFIHVYFLTYIYLFKFRIKKQLLR